MGGAEEVTMGGATMAMGTEGAASGRTAVGWQEAEGRMHGEAKRSNRFGVGGGGGVDG